MLERLGIVLYWLGIILAGLWVLGVSAGHNWNWDGELLLLAFGPAFGLYLVGRALLFVLAGR